MGTIQPLQHAEARVLGVLIEKSMTTPESYPLSLNALVNGCNQKSNREPVTHLDEQTVNEAMRDLRMNRLAVEVSNRSSRVVKFSHKARERLEVDEPTLAILAELLLRGPQTPGELRGRASRMAPIASLGALDGLLGRLSERQMVVQLSPLPGSRAVRFMQLIAPGLHEAGSVPSAAQPAARPAASEPPPAPGAVTGATPTAVTADRDPADRATVTVNEPAVSGAVPPTSPAPLTPAIAAPSGDLAVRVAALEEQVESLTSIVAQLRRRMGPPVER